MVREEIIKTVDDWSNSFLRPHIPPKLLSSSTITKTEDDGAKLIYAKFLYGEITGQFKHIPFDGSYGNIIDDISQQSLWIYSFDKDKFPSGFEALTYNPGIIRTGKVQKCGYCSGHGKVTCTKCKGRVRWSEKDLFSDKIIDKVCSCGDGKQLCRDCDGYGEVETVIEVKKSFRLFETKNSQYHGEVPEDKIKKITGHPIFEEVIEYPMNDVKEMLLGGINTEEFNELNNTVLDIMHEKVDNELADKGVNTKLIHEQINTLFKSVPNPGRDNKLLEKEVMPIRVMVKVEDAPVTQIDYSFKEKEYSIWLFGNENRIWYQTAPFSFNYKMITLTVLFLLIVGGGIFNYFNKTKSAYATDSVSTENVVVDTNVATPGITPENSNANNDQIIEEESGETPIVSDQNTNILSITEEEQIKNTILAYFDCNKVNIDCFQKYYAQTVRRVYNRRNLSVDETMQEHRNYYNIYPFQEAYVDQNSFVISKNSAGEIETRFILETRIKKKFEDNFKRFSSLNHMVFNSDHKLIEIYNENSRRIQ
jgi:hypothetical protein